MFQAHFADQVAARNALVQRRPRRRAPRNVRFAASTISPPVKRKRKPRVRRSRSRNATRDAERDARVKAAEVQAGMREPPKRNQVFLLDPKAIGLEQHGMFWYNTTDPASFYFMNEKMQRILDAISEYWKQPGNLEKFHKARSMDDGDKSCTETPGQRSYENFFTFHCKQNRVVVKVGDTLIDVKSDYNAMLTRFGRRGFDSFCRGNVVVFDAPGIVVEKWQVAPDDLSDMDEDDILEMQALQEGALTPARTGASQVPLDPPPKETPKQSAPEETTELSAEKEEPAKKLTRTEAQKKTNGLRPMLTTNAAQLNFFHWIFVKNYDKFIEDRHRQLHKQVNQSIKSHKQKKAEENIDKRMELTRKYTGSFVVDSAVDAAEKGDAGEV